MNRPRIIYLTNARLPTEKAHGLATVKLSEAFAKAGADVIVIAPWRRNSLREDPFAYYGVEHVFRIVRFPSVDLLWLPFGKSLTFPIQLFSFSLVAALWLFFRYGMFGRMRDVVIFSHDHIPLFFVCLFAPNIFLDIHDYPTENVFFRRVLKRAIGCAVQTKQKIDGLVRNFGISREQIVYWPNGTDVERFRDIVPRSEAQKRLGIPAGRSIVLYTGSLQSWKGVDTLVRAAGLLPPSFQTYIVGGSPSEIAPLERLAPETAGRFVGHRPWREMPLWLAAADILVLPNTGREEISRSWTSPMKLFEYMASGRPIVASDIPSIREIVDEAMAFLAAPDDPQAFASAIKAATNDRGGAALRARRAQAEAGRYTWVARAEAILELMRRLQFPGRHDTMPHEPGEPSGKVL